ncbi:unnamed protein product [Allacma fusca]|uniref:Uncharacterized protein n=1 Tax=Allacma fusca TaxID=39272 RepID=A0A8J2KI05_9HEXA|nr:unnamed protein product [Allacma fusca]
MLGAKFTDLFLAEKNLIDFVEKNLGQERDRLKQDELEMESVCHHLEVRAIIPKRFGFGFANAVIHCGEKIRTHIIECTMECTQSGRLENLYPIISNVVVIRNYIWIFQELVDSETKSKLKPEYKEFCELVEVISEQMMQVQANLLLTYIVHNEESQDWDSHQLYYEGERGSPTIQMWIYFLKSMQQDMWKIMPPQLAQRIFGIIVSDSLGVLVARYTKIKPAEAKTPQFVCDIVNILAAVEELLCYVAPDLALLCGATDMTSSKTINSIHLKCQCLVASLVLVGCPLDILYKSFRRGLSSCALLEKRVLNPSKLSEPIWSEIIKSLTPKFYPTNLTHPDWELLYSLKLLCSQPTPNWPLVYRVVAMQEGKIASIILSLFPTVVAPVNDFMLEGKSFQMCRNASCLSPDCHSLAKSLPNHYAAACTLYMVAHAMPRFLLVKVYRPVLTRIVDWSVMDKTQMWSSKSRPVWFQSLIDLLLPILKTCVQSLCLSIISMENSVPQTEDTFTQLVIDLLNGLTEMLSVIPRGFFLLFTTLYMLLNLGSKIAYIPPPPPPVEGPCERHEAAGSSISVVQAGKANRDKKKTIPDILESLLLSVAERLCHLDDRVFDQSVHRLVTQIESMMKQMQTLTKTQEHLQDSAEYEDDHAMLWDIANLKADFLLEEVEGQLALKIVYKFIFTHGDLLQKIITGDSNSASNIKKNHAKASSTKPPVSANQSNVNSIPPAVTTGGASSVHSSQPQQKPDIKSVSTQKESSSSIKNSASFAQVAKLNFNLLKIAPRIRTYFKPSNIIHDFHFVNSYRLYDEIMWNYEDNVDWVQVVRCSKLNLHKTTIMKHLERRWEFRQSNEDDPMFSTSDLSPDKKNFINKMVEESKALLMTV